MKQRFRVDDAGQLVDREGTVVGRITSITLDIPVGERGVKGFLPSTAIESSSNVDVDLNLDGGPGETNGGPKDDVEIVWSRYQELIPNGRRYHLDQKKRAIIRKALACGAPAGETPLDRVLRAVAGLAASPHHNGHNDRRKKYLGIRYALQGIGAESTDERIEKMIAIGEKNGASAKRSASRANYDPSVMTMTAYLDTLPSGVREIVSTHVENICRMRQSPDHATLQRLGTTSQSVLANTWGLEVVTSVSADDRIKLEGVREMEQEEAGDQ